MASPRAWLLSLVMAGGVVGGGTMALQAAPGSPVAGKPSAPVAESQQLPSSQQLEQLMKQDRALRAALAQARRQFEAELAAGRAANIAARHVSVAAPATEPAEQEPAEPEPSPTHTQAPEPRDSDESPVATPAPSPPPTHATTGASGSTGSDDGYVGEHDGAGEGDD